MNLITFITTIVVALILGGVLGWQRSHIGKQAGLRTYALVSFGSALFTLLSVHGFSGDPARVAAQILAGIGFIGAGTIIHKSGGIEGLTTAAGLWASAALGMAVGVGWYLEATIATILMFIVLWLNDKS